MSCLLTTHYPYKEELFCEGKWNARGPDHGDMLEVGNAITALAIIYIGAYQLIAWQGASPMVNLISGLFVLNGISSCLNHSTGEIWWHFMDEMTMVVAAWYGLALVVHDLMEKLVKRYEEDEPIKYWDTLDGRVKRATMWIVVLLVIWSQFLYQLEGCPHGSLSHWFFPGYFILLFASPLVFGLLLVLVIHRLWAFDVIQVRTFADYKRAWTGAKKGVIAMAIGLGSWIVTETQCLSSVFFKWFPGHAIWHLFMPWGISQALLYLTMVRADDYNMVATFEYPDPDAPIILKVYRALFPRLVFKTITCEHCATTRESRSSIVKRESALWKSTSQGLEAVRREFADVVFESTDSEKNCTVVVPSPTPGFAPDPEVPEGTRRTESGTFRLGEC